MQKIPLNLATPGMKLAKPVTRENGMVVIAEGMELTDSLIARMENMNIDKIVVKGNPVDLGGEGGDTAFGKRLERLDHLFRRQDSPWMQKVKEFFHKYFKLKAAQQAKARECAEDEENLECAEGEGENDE